LSAKSQPWQAFEAHLGPFLFHISLGFASGRHVKMDPRAPNASNYYFKWCDLLTVMRVFPPALLSTTFKVSFTAMLQKSQFN
jgi:hypothetical protein